MRINGTYPERYFFTTFPWVLTAGILCYFFLTKNILIIGISILLMTLIAILLNGIFLKKYHLLKVTLHKNKLYVDGQLIEENKISVIRPYETQPPGSCLLIELYLDNNTCLRFMDKPKSLFHKTHNKFNSKSFDIIFKEFPTLKKKIRAQKY